MAVAESSPQPEAPRFPQVSSLDLKKVELFYDVDLDEFTVLFYGRKRRHLLRAISDNAYALVDPASEDLVGVEFHNFIKRYLPRDPSLGSAISIATILSDELGERHETDSPPAQAPLDQLYERWKRIATPRRIELREALSSLLSLSNREMVSGR